MALEYPDYRSQQEKLQVYANHNLYDLLGQALQEAIVSGTLSEEDFEAYVRNISLQFGFNVGDYGLDLQYNAPNPLGIDSGNLDYKASVSFPIDIKGF